MDEVDRGQKVVVLEELVGGERVAHADLGDPLGHLGRREHHAAADGQEDVSQG